MMMMMMMILINNNHNNSKKLYNVVPTIEMDFSSSLGEPFVHEVCNFASVWL